MNLNKLTEAIAEVCPVHGVCIGSESDKSTWKPDYKPEATEAEKAAAQAVIDAADLSIVADIKYVPCRDIIARLRAIGKYSTVRNAMSQDQLDDFFALKEGVDAQDTDVRALLAACGIDPDLILY